MQKKIYEGKSAILLLSGGQDSTTCLWWAKQAFDRVEAVGFDYGQRHARELECAARIAGLAGVDFHVVNLKGLLGGSSLTEHALDHSASHAINPDLPASFTAGRNALFLTLAASLGHGRGIKDIITGVCQTDYSGYPDCRKCFVDSMQVSLSLAMDCDFQIHAPLMYLTKAETWRWAKELGCLDVVREMTLTDYNGSDISNEWGWGVEDNPATILRAKGYREAVERGWL